MCHSSSLSDTQCVTYKLIYISIGISKFFADVKQMTGWNPSLILRSHIVVMISTCAPIVIAIILYKDASNLLWNTDVIRYGKNYVYPDWAHWIARGIVFVSVVALPCGAIHHIIKVFLSGNIIKSLKASLKPTKAWRRNAELNKAMTSDSPVQTIGTVTTRLSGFYPELDANNGVINPAFITTD